MTWCASHTSAVVDQFLLLRQTNIVAIVSFRLRLTHCRSIKHDFITKYQRWIVLRSAHEWCCRRRVASGGHIIRRPPPTTTTSDPLSLSLSRGRRRPASMVFCGCGCRAAGGLAVPGAGCRSLSLQTWKLVTCQTNLQAILETKCLCSNFVIQGE